MPALVKCSSIIGATGATTKSTLWAPAGAPRSIKSGTASSPWARSVARPPRTDPSTGPRRFHSASVSCACGGSHVRGPAPGKAGFGFSLKEIGCMCQIRPVDPATGSEGHHKVLTTRKPGTSYRAHKKPSLAYMYNTPRAVERKNAPAAEPAWAGALARSRARALPLASFPSQRSAAPTGKLVS